MIKRLVTLSAVLVVAPYVRRTAQRLLDQLHIGVGGQPPRPARTQSAMVPFGTTQTHFQAFRGTAAEQSV